MTWSVDRPVQIGETRFAAIVDQKVTTNAFGFTLTGFAQKQPILIVYICGAKVAGVDLSGQVFDAERINVLYPDAIAQIRAK